jgi:hypothetical protein
MTNSPRLPIYIYILNRVQNDVQEIHEIDHGLIYY